MKDELVRKMNLPLQDAGRVAVASGVAVSGSGDADKVDGLDASTTPLAGTLLALNQAGQWPLETMPFVGTNPDQAVSLFFGQTYVAPTALLRAPCFAGDNTIVLDRPDWADVGDKVVFMHPQRTNEEGTITGAGEAYGGQWRYGVSRTGSQNWPAGTAVANLGSVEDGGYITLNSGEREHASARKAPHINLWQRKAGGDERRVRLGRLSGLSAAEKAYFPEEEDWTNAWGLYTDRIYARGLIHATGGNLAGDLLLGGSLTVLGGRASAVAQVGRTDAGYGFALLNTEMRPAFAAVEPYADEDGAAGEVEVFIDHQGTRGLWYHKVNGEYRLDIGVDTLIGGSLRVGERILVGVGTWGEDFSGIAIDSGYGLVGVGSGDTFNESPADGSYQVWLNTSTGELLAARGDMILGYAGVRFVKRAAWDVADWVDLRWEQADGTNVAALGPTVQGGLTASRWTTISESSGESAGVTVAPDLGVYVTAGGAETSNQYAAGRYHYFIAGGRVPAAFGEENWMLTPFTIYGNTTWTWDDEGRLGVGVGVGEAEALLHVQSLTETQMRLSAGASSYLDVRASEGHSRISTSHDLILDPLSAVLPEGSYTTDLGSVTAKWHRLYAAELIVNTLVAEDVRSDIGGRVLVGSTSELVFALGAGSTVMYSKHDSMSSGDLLFMEGGGNVEWIQVDSGPATGDGYYEYQITRDVDGSGANDWPAGTALFNTGQAPSGWIDLYAGTAMDGAAAGPAIAGWQRLSSAYDDYEERWAIGNLDGLFGVSGTTWGVAFGGPNTTHIIIDASNGYRIRHGTTTLGQWDINGDLTLGATGNVQITAAGDVTVTGDITADTLTANTAGSIGGWTINPSSLSAGSIVFDPVTPSIRLGDATGFLTGIGIWMGNDGGSYKLHIGDPAGDYFYWNGNELSFTGTVIGGSSVDGTDSNTFTINSDLDDATAELVLGRTTGGSMTLSWDGSAASFDKTLYAPVLGVGTASPGARMGVEGQSGDSTILELAGESDLWGMNFAFTLNSNGVGSAPTAFRMVPTINVTGATGTVYNWNANIIVTGNQTLSNLYGMYVKPTLSASFSGVIPNFYGLRIHTPTISGGTLTNYRGVDLQDISAGIAGTAYGIRSAISSGYHLYFDGAAAIYTAGNLTLDGELAAGNVASDLIPALTDTYDLGSSSKLWRKGWLSELDAILFVENSVQVTGGWWMVPHQSGTLVGDVGTGDTQIDFGTALNTNDFILLRGNLKVEYMQVTGYVSGTTYTVTRDLDGTGANTWPAGHVFVVLGYEGDGRIEFDAQTAGPQVRITEQGSSYNAQTERVRLGELDGWGGGVSGYGIAFGNYAGGDYLYYSPGSGIVIAADGSGMTNIDGGNIQTGSITATQIAANTITADEIASETITAGEIAAGTITGGKIAASTITASNIAAGTITATEIAAATITGGKIAASTITASNIAASTITASNIASGTITATQIAAATITGGKIAASTITASNLSVSSLSTISADMGSLTAGNIVIGSSNKIWINHNNDGAINVGGSVKGSAPFNVSATGAMTSTSGAIGGWSIGSTTLAGGNATLSSSGYLSLGTGNDVVRLDATNATFRLWIGHATDPYSAWLKITKVGALYATNADISGTITSTSGTIGGFTLSSTTLSNGGFIIDSANKKITWPSGGYMMDVAGGLYTPDIGVGTLNFQTALTYPSAGSPNFYVNSSAFVSKVTTYIDASVRLGLGGSGVGFYGTTPAGKQTVSGSRGGNAALASLLTALATLGLITNSSSA